MGRTGNVFSCLRQQISAIKILKYDKSGFANMCASAAGCRDELCRILDFQIKTLLVDHFITVLEVNPDTVTIGDPLNGRETLSYTAFAERWRFVGVIVKQSSSIE